MKYVEANGCCFNIDEKMKLEFALFELAHELKLEKVWLVGKVQGKLVGYISYAQAKYKIKQRKFQQLS